jgi:DNA gyrase subunit A
MALERIDKIIATIKKSKNRNIAKHNLIKEFSFTDRQAEAILQMRLQALAGLERLKVEKELAQRRELIKELESILKTPEKIMGIIVSDLQKLKKSYGDERRTTIFQEPVGAFLKEDLIPKETAIVMITKDGYIKRLSPKSFKSQARGGQGVVGLTRKEQDAVQHLLCADTHSDLLFFTDSGKVFQLKTFDVPEASRTAKGQAVVNFLELEHKEAVTAVLALADFARAKYLVMATQGGVIKKVAVTEFGKVRRSGLIAIKLKANDLLKWVKLSSGQEEIMLTTAQGMSIRFTEKHLRPMGRTARGVIGIKLAKDDQLVGMDIVKPKEVSGFLLAISKNGCGKMTNLKNYRTQFRAGKGIKTMKITDKTGALTSAQVVYPKNLPSDKKGDLILISEKGQVIRIKLAAVPVQGRATQGVRLMRLKKGKDDKVSQVVIV